MTQRRRAWELITASTRDESSEFGQGLAEYALVLAFVAMACVMALGALGGAVANSPGFSILPGAL
jgi:Flp pilus assembly pilin Flp